MSNLHIVLDPRPHSKDGKGSALSFFVDGVPVTVDGYDSLREREAGQWLLPVLIEVGRKLGASVDVELNKDALEEIVAKFRRCDDTPLREIDE